MKTRSGTLRCARGFEWGRNNILRYKVEQIELLIVASPMIYIIIHSIKYFFPSMDNHVLSSASQVPSPTVTP